MDQLLSPTECAQKVMAELLDNVEAPDFTDSVMRRQRVVRLIRQLVRDHYERCAQAAEMWVPLNDVCEQCDGMAVGDAIAETFREMADERELERVRA